MDDKEAVVLACTSLVFCASISATTSVKSEVDMSTPAVHAVSTPLNTCRACRASRDGRVVPRCPTSATQHVTTFSCSTMHGLHSVSSVASTGESWGSSNPLPTESGKRTSVTKVKCFRPYLHYNDVRRVYEINVGLLSILQQLCE